MKAAACLLLAGLLPAGARAQTTLRVLVPATTPAGPLYVAGSFNAWQPAAPAYALARQADGSYQLTLPATVSGPQEFKLTRGAWETGEADASFQPRANRHANFGPGPATLPLQVVAWQDQRPAGAPAAAAPKAPTRSRNVQVLADSFRMPQLHNRARRVWLYLPPGYSDSGLRRYPVLYLQDGQNVFDNATAYSGEWGVDETLDRMAATATAPACIVVAVDNGGDRRLNEYSPWVNPELKQGGEGAAYVNFLAFTLKPYIDRHYRTRPDAAHTAIAGSSMGGLISLYAGLKYPQLFGRVGVFSPATWFAKDSLLRYEARHRPAPLGSRFYFVAGPAESETMLPLMTEARDALRARGVPAAHLQLQAPADGQHAEWFWRREFGPAYRWLLAR